MKEAEWREYRLCLPHFRLQGATYFVTWRLAPSQSELIGPERTVVVEALQHLAGQRYDLSAFVVMNDHVHALVHPHPDWRLEEIIHSWKSFTAHTFVRSSGRQAPVWLHESYDRIVRDRAEFDEKLAYILNNPKKRWPSLTEYEWMGCSLRSS